MVFHVPPPTGATFEFTLPGDDTVYRIPLARNLKPTFALRLNGLSEGDAGALLMEELLPGVLDKLDDLEQLEALIRAWTAASGVSVGESSASSTA